MKKVLVSGIKPTGDVHFGNYFGAIKQNINLAQNNDYESFLFIADYHALTSLNDFDSSKKIKEYTYKIFASYVACGLDSNKIFRQSDIREHIELSYIFSNLISMPFMMRAHAFKDAEAKNKDINVGTFYYPILMAADILIYDADLVPVGRDQKQHLEYTRDIAGYFNRAYKGDYFKLPKELILDEVAIIPGIDGKKMSKSYDNYIELFSTEENLRKKVFSIVTDSLTPEDKKDPDQNNIYNIHKYFLTEEENIKLRERFLSGGLSYKEAKESLYQSILKWRDGKIDVYNTLLSDTDKIEKTLLENASKVRPIAQKKIKQIREVVGLD